jgi:hypothetical protein
MAMPNKFKSLLLSADHNLGSATVRVALGGDSTAYTYDQDAHEFVSDVFDGGTTGEELSDSSYSRQTLSGTTVSQDNTDDEGVWDADDVTFASIDTTQDIQFILVYVQVGGDDTTPGDDPIVTIYDDDSAGSLSELPHPTNGSDVIISWDSEGIVNTQ